MPGEQEPSATVSQRQGYGCLALALFSLIGTALFVVLGIQCMQRHDLFDCIGLLTIFPAAFAAIGLVSAAIGLQRFTTAGRQNTTATRLRSLETGWQPLRSGLPPDIVSGPDHRSDRNNRSLPEVGADAADRGQLEQDEDA